MMGKRAMYFLLRTGTAAFVLGAIVCLGAYAQGALCLELLLTPACLLLAAACRGAERELRAASRRLRLRTGAAGGACVRPEHVFLIKSRRAS